MNDPNNYRYGELFEALLNDKNYTDEDLERDIQIASECNHSLMIYKGKKENGKQCRN